MKKRNAIGLNPDKSEIRLPIEYGLCAFVRTEFRFAEVYIRLLFFCLLVGVLPAVSFSQDGWTANLFEQKVFIENKGQFDEKDELPGPPIYFGVDNMGFQIYYTSEGLTYRMDEWGMTESDAKKLMEREGKEAGERQEQDAGENELKRSTLLASSLVHLRWLHSNPEVQIIPSEQVAEYFNYGMGSPEKSINYVKGFQKLLYKDLYPGIDVEYTFHEKEGTKYALIVHPGADVSKVQMQYTGADKINMDERGNIRLSTCFGDIIDHAPITFYDENKNTIPSSFSLNNNSVRFNVSEYNHSKTLIIDPWTKNPTFPNTNKGLRIDTDTAGNVYVYGSNSPFRLKKYDSNGNVKWTYNATGLLVPNWCGDLTTDKAGNSYISNAISNGAMEKISTAGGLSLSNYNVRGSSIWITELFNLCFNKSQTQLVGGWAGPGVSVGNIDGTLTMVGTTKITSVPISEIRGITSSPNGNYYALSVSNGKCIAFKPNFTNIWTVSSGYSNASFGYYAPAYTGWTLLISGTRSPYPNGQNCIAASDCYVYTYNGDTLCKRNISYGFLVTSVKVAGGIAGQNSGILVDSCDNVYVGTTTGISKYDQNLTLDTSVSTPGAVYDLAFGINREICATGNAMVASVAGLVQNCVQVTIAVNINTTNATCGVNNGSATAGVSGGSVPYTFLWNPGGQTTQTATGLSAGVYTITVTEGSCAKITQTQTLSITESSALTATATSTPACGTGTGTAAAAENGGTSPYTYSWVPSGGGSPIVTGLLSGNYTCTISDANGCTATTTVNVIVNTNPTAGAGNNVTIISGESATLSASGGVSYNWAPSSGLSNAAISDPTASPAITTLYCVTVTDTNNCSDIACVLVYVDDPCLDNNKLFLPNAFSPNNDGENDVFCLQVSDNCIKQILISVYDRWGEKVFTTTDFKKCWDGTSKGKVMNTAVFVYFMEATLMNGENIRKKGNISLMK